MTRIATAARAMLEGNILPFWMALRDDEYGGYYGYMDFDLCLDKKAEKGCILHSRILWFFSEAALLTGRQDLLDEAKHAYQFLTHFCLDWRNGGVYWSVNYDGAPRDRTKHTYAQAFALYALSAYYRLTGNGEVLEQAWKLFELIERKCADTEGYQEAFTEDWKPVSNEKLSENGVLAAKTMNTLLHLFEAYSGLYQAVKAPSVERAMRRMLKLYTTKIYSPQLKRQLVFFDEQYHSLIDLYSYGHDIESSWLMDWGCSLLGDEVLRAEIAEIDSTLAEQVYQSAYSKHSLANEWERGVVDSTRVWWVQAEAVLGFVNEFQKHPEHTKFCRAAGDIFCYIRRVMVDQRSGGEWFWEVNEEGVPSSRKPIVTPWKCPYHNGRMCMELIRRDPDVYVSLTP